MIRGPRNFSSNQWTTDDRRHSGRPLGADIPAITPTVAACRQSVDRLVASAGDGTVQFHFAARDGVCGNGRNFFRASEMGYYSSYNNGMGGDDICSMGPACAVIVRAGREIIKIETYAGPLANDPDGGKDLGASLRAVMQRSYLIGLAGTLEVSALARDVMQPAMLRIRHRFHAAVDAPCPRSDARGDIRSSAISWLARRRLEPGGVGAAAAQHTLDAIVRDRNESETIRRQALTTLVALIARGFRCSSPLPATPTAGFPSRRSSPSPIPAIRALGSSCGRQYVVPIFPKRAVCRQFAASATRRVASGLLVLREPYPTVNSGPGTERDRSTLVATAGGSENAEWLLALAKSSTEPAARRRQAVSALSRNDDPKASRNRRRDWSITEPQGNTHDVVVAVAARSRSRRRVDRRAGGGVHCAPPPAGSAAPQPTSAAPAPRSARLSSRYWPAPAALARSPPRAETKARGHGLAKSYSRLSPAGANAGWR